MKEIIQLLPFIMWDRYTDDKVWNVTMYGWIERKKDAYKDFVVVFFHDGEQDGFVTSSAEWTNTISKMLEYFNAEHNDCIRVETLYPDMPNVIKLS